MRAPGGQRQNSFSYVLIVTVLIVSCWAIGTASAQSGSSATYLPQQYNTATDDDFQAAELYRHARQDYKSKKYLAAMRHLRQLIDSYPTTHFAALARRDLPRLAKAYRVRRYQATRSANRNSFTDQRMGVGAMPPRDAAQRGTQFTPAVHQRATDDTDNDTGDSLSPAIASSDQQPLWIETNNPPATYGPAVPTHLRTGTIPAAAPNNQSAQLSILPRPKLLSAPKQVHRQSALSSLISRTVPPKPRIITSKADIDRPVIAAYKYRANDTFIMATANRIFFGQASVGLGTRARAVIRSQAGWLTTHPEMLITINGHADEQGSPQFNKTISRQRAEAVRTYLATLGIARDRIEISAHGRQDRVAKCRSPSCTAQNRRVVTTVGYRQPDAYEAQYVR